MNDDDDDAFDDDHILESQRGDDHVDVRHWGAHRRDRRGLEAHLTTLLRHLQRGDFPAARSWERARRDRSHPNELVVLRYFGARELLALTEELPATAIAAYARALVGYTPGVAAPSLAHHWANHRSDAWRALQRLRYQPNSVLRELALANEPRFWRLYHWFATYDQTWAQLALLAVVIVIGIIVQRC